MPFDLPIDATHAIGSRASHHSPSSQFCGAQQGGKWSKRGRPSIINPHLIHPNLHHSVWTYGCVHNATQYLKLSISDGDLLQQR